MAKMDDIFTDKMLVWYQIKLDLNIFLFAELLVANNLF